MDQVKQNDLCSERTPALENGNGNSNGTVRCVRSPNGSAKVKILTGLLVAACIAIVVLVTVLVFGSYYWNRDKSTSRCNFKNKSHNSPAILSLTTERVINSDEHIPTRFGAQLLNFSSCGISTTDRLFHGQEAALGQFPWMVLLFNSKGQAICGGTLISEQYVLTAAHCDQDIKTLRIGEHNVTSNPDCADIFREDCTTVQNFTVTKNDIIKHPYYSPSKKTNDIALIKLPEPVNMTDNDIVPICLPYDNFRYDYTGQSGESMTISGWGVTEGGKTSNVLMFAKVITKSSRECEKVYRNISPKAILDERIICAAGDKEQNHCSGDSGGPLQFTQDFGKGPHTVLHGIMAYGEIHCTSNGLPSTYTRVSYYIEWILNNMK